MIVFFIALYAIKIFRTIYLKACGINVS